MNIHFGFECLTVQHSQGSAQNQHCDSRRRALRDRSEPRPL